MRRRTLIQGAAAALAPTIGRADDITVVQACVAAYAQALHDGDARAVNRMKRELIALGVVVRQTPEGIYWTRA